MDARIQSLSIDKLSMVSADALLVVLAGDNLPQSLDPALAGAVKAAQKLGDFELKAGKAVLLHQVEGLKAPRLVLAASGKTSIKAAKAAIVAAPEQTVVDQQRVGTGLCTGCLRFAGLRLTL